MSAGNSFSRLFIPRNHFRHVELWFSHPLVPRPLIFLKRFFRLGLSKLLLLDSSSFALYPQVILHWITHITGVKGLLLQPACKSILFTSEQYVLQSIWRIYVSLMASRVVWFLNTTRVISEYPLNRELPLVTFIPYTHFSKFFLIPKGQSFGYLS